MPEKTIVEIAQEKYDKAQNHWADIYGAAREDLDFLSDAKNAQWSESDYSKRKRDGRPAITIDQLGQFTHHVINSIRMNTPSINVIPAGKEADIETAEIFKGLIKNIEYVSAADDAYDFAVSNSVRCSIGFIRVDHDYSYSDGFEQDLQIKRVINPFACYIDADSIEPDGSDAKYGFYLDEISVEEFESKYPGKEPCSFNGEIGEKLNQGDKVTIAEYFLIEEEDKEIGLLEDGEIEEYSEDKEYKTKRKITRKKVRRYILSGKDKLEETTFPGKYIPIVPVYGEECWNDGKRNLHSLIRRAKEAQRMFNLWKSLETELLMKAPIAPVLAAEGQVEAFAKDWTDPSSTMVLRYKQTDLAGNPAPRPERISPPQVPTGVVNASRQSIDDIKATMGIYNASLGAKSNETSGIAINQRKEEGEVATFHFGDNLNKSISQVGRILVCAIPEVYDTPRIIRIIGEEDEPKNVGVNGQMVAEQERAFDLRKGIFDVRVVTGASNTTKRQEAAQFFHDIVTRQPELMNIMGDLLFKNMDFTGAPAMASRMKKIIEQQNPQFFEEDAEQDPQVMALEAKLAEAQAIIQQGQAEMQSLQEQLQNKQQLEVMKAEEAVHKAQIEMEKLRLDEQESVGEYEIKQAELRLKERELALKEAEFQLKVLSSQSEFEEDSNHQPSGDVTLQEVIY